MQQGTIYGALAETTPDDQGYMPIDVIEHGMSNKQQQLESSTSVTSRTMLDYIGICDTPVR